MARVRLALFGLIFILSSVLCPVTVFARLPVVFDVDFSLANHYIPPISQRTGTERQGFPFDNPDYYLSAPPGNENELTRTNFTFIWLPQMVTETGIFRREEGLEMRGVIPEINELYGWGRHALNAQIEQAVNNRIITAKEAKARSIVFEYDIYVTDSIVSIILLSTTTSATSKKEVSSINFEPRSGEIKSLAEAAGAGIAPLAEKLLTEMIRRNPERYNTTFNSSQLGTQPFFLTDYEVVLLFDEFQVLSSADGIMELALDLSRIETVTLSRDEYHILPGGYHLKMVPLRKVCEGLGYRIRWEAAENFRIEVYQNGLLIIELETNVNYYEIKDKKARSLEAAPEMIWGMIYVPISFFDQILSMITYSVDEWENITFLSYTE
jgi:hypothetical protein